MESATVVLYPSPGAGHLTSMVELGKYIHTYHPSLCVTILIIPPPNGLGSIDKYITKVSATNSSITSHHLPTISIPPDFISNHIKLNFGIPELYNSIVHNTLVTISEKSSIKAVILDFFSNAAFEVAKSLTDGASGLCVFLHIPTIHNTKEKSIEDLNNYLDLPGVPPFHSSDMPKLLFDRNSYPFKILLKTASNMRQTSGLIANSFAGFEQRAVITKIASIVSFIDNQIHHICVNTCVCVYAS